MQSGLFLLATPIFNTVFRNATQGAFLLQIAAWAVIFSLLAQTAFASLNGTGKMYVPVFAVSCAAIIKYTLNIIFIPIYGEVIAPMTTISYHFTAAMIAMIFLYTSLKSKPDLKNTLIKPLIATIFMIFAMFLANKLALYISNRNVVLIVLSLVAAITVYTTAIIRLKVFNKAEIESIPYVNRICKTKEKVKKV